MPTLSASPTGNIAVAPRSKVLGTRYAAAFVDWLRSGAQSPRGDAMAALYESSNPAGGFAVPVSVDGQIVPLAPVDTGARELATVIVTQRDLNIPYETVSGTATAKAENTGFGGVSPALGSFLLSAFMAGAENDISFELLQDVQTLPDFLVQDMLRAQQAVESRGLSPGAASVSRKDYSETLARV